MSVGVAAGETELSRPEVAAAATATFGANTERARHYAELLAGDGIAHGHLGPREAARIWSRHLLNCVVVAELIDAEATVLDLGSGAGLPGIPVALARPDLEVILLEPMQRRAAFLERCREDLRLANVRICRGRAQPGTTAIQRADGRQGVSLPPVQVVLARAVAPLARLTDLALPACGPGGHLLALKGASVVDESVELAARADLDVRILTVADPLGTPVHIACVRRAVPDRAASTARSRPQAQRARDSRARKERP